MGYLGWGLPGLIVSKTFNEYTRRSRWWAHFKLFKDVVLLGKTPEYKARLEYKRGQQWHDKGEVSFSALYATALPTCRYVTHIRVLGENMTLYIRYWVFVCVLGGEGGLK